MYWFHDQSLGLLILRRTSPNLKGIRKMPGSITVFKVHFLHNLQHTPEDFSVALTRKSFAQLPSSLVIEGPF